MKILFLHGFFASGQCVPALALREAFEGKAEVLTPDLPMHPQEAINYICDLIDKEKPDLLVGNSCGSFYAQMIAPIVGLPTLLGNPHFKMTEFLKPRIGAHQYKSPRQDGKQDFVIDEQLIAEFAELERHQFDNYKIEYVPGRPPLRRVLQPLPGSPRVLPRERPLRRERVPVLQARPWPPCTPVLPADPYGSDGNGRCCRSFCP